MVEGREPGQIEIASKHMSIDSLRNKATAKRKIEERALAQIQVDFSHLEKPFQNIAEGQRDLIESLNDQKISLDNFLSLSQKQSGELVESLKKAPQRVERERWVDAEYAQDFFTRFTPNLEPNFYTQLPRKEREKFNVRWQLARAAFYKQAINGTPDKYRESEDLNTMGKEKMETLYNIKGVREMLQGYTQAIIDGRTFVDKETGDTMSFWDLDSADKFHRFRKAIRSEMLSGVSFDEEIDVLPENVHVEAHSDDERNRWIDLFKKEADAIAWNWLWVSNLAESANSRYADSAAGYSRSLPGIITADEFQHVLHPQERFEGKCRSGHFWKAFGKWGVYHYRRLTDKLGDVEIWCTPAKKSEYWEISKMPENTIPRDEKNRERKTKVYKMKVPECYPVTTTKSFLEMTKCQKGKTLLEAFQERENIDWSEVPQDAWAIYLWGKFHKGYQLLEYWDNMESGKAGKPIEIGKPYGVKTWADPLLELFVRLNPMETINEIKEKGKMKSKEPQTYQSPNNLKVWAVIASTGGVNDVRSRKPQFNLSFDDKNILSLALRHRNVGFLNKKEKLSLN